MDQGLFHQELELRISQIPREATPEGLNFFSAKVLEALHDSLILTTPENKKRSFRKPGYTKESKVASRLARRTRQHFQGIKSRFGLRNAYTIKMYRRMLKHNKGKKQQWKSDLREDHRTKFSEAAGDIAKVWKLAKWVKNRATPFSPFTPDLRRPNQSMATTKREKAATLAARFFPEPTNADLSDIEGYDYPEQIPIPYITMEEVSAAIRKPPPHNAPGEDELPNIMPQKGLLALREPLTWLFNECLKQGHHPISFKSSITVALRKPEKKDYSISKHYRPIALLSTLGKALESIVASRLLYLGTEHTLIPENHFDGRKGTTTEHALHMLTEKISSIWRQKRVCSLLCLDVIKAFNNVNHPRLLHNLRKRKVGSAIVN